MLRSEQFSRENAAASSSVPAGDCGVAQVCDLVTEPCQRLQLSQRQRLQLSCWLDVDDLQHAFQSFQSAMHNNSLSRVLCHQRIWHSRRGELFVMLGQEYGTQIRNQAGVFTLRCFPQELHFYKKR